MIINCNKIIETDEDGRKEIKWTLRDMFMLTISNMKPKHTPLHSDHSRYFQQIGWRWSNLSQ